MMYLTYGPQHTVGYLVAHLYQFGLGTSLFHRLECLGGVVVDIAAKGIHGVVGPVGGDKLFAGVGPRVGIVEVEHKLHAGILYLFAKLGDIGNILAYTFFLIMFGSLVGIDKEAHACGIPSALLEKAEGIDSFSVGITIDGVLLLILRKHTYVGSQ